LRFYIQSIASVFARLLCLVWDFECCSEKHLHFQFTIFIFSKTPIIVVKINLSIFVSTNQVIVWDEIRIRFVSCSWCLEAYVRPGYSMSLSCTTNSSVKVASKLFWQTIQWMYLHVWCILYQQKIIIIEPLHHYFFQL